MSKLILLILTIFFAKKVNGYDSLGRYNVDPNGTTISGFSSGGFMTVQMQYIYSKVFKGSGTFAGGPYGVSHGIDVGNVIQFHTALAQIMFGSRNDITRMEELVRNFSDVGLIDDLSYLRGTPIYVFHGVLDTIVNYGYALTVVKMYENFGADVETDLHVWATHGVPTDNYGGWCKFLAPNHNFLNNCGFEGVFDLFNKIYGSSYVAPESSSTIYTGNLSYFDQAEFASNNDAGAIGFEDKAHVYVPLKCQDLTIVCRVHVALHGCAMTAVDWMLVESDYPFVTRAGYLQVADANNVIIIFPRVMFTLSPFNGGCWDFVGYTDSDYQFNIGKQPRAIINMLRRLGIPVQ